MSNNVIVKNRDYSLYLAGVINEEQFMRLCDDGMSELGGISLRLESEIGRAHV